MKDDSNPDEEKTPASPGTPEGAEPGTNETREREASFTRRALIESGWTMPVILSVVLPDACSPRARAARMLSTWTTMPTF